MQWLRALIDAELFRVAGTVVTGATLVSMVIVVVVGMLLSRGVRVAVTHALHLRGRSVEGRWETLLRLLHYTIVGSALLVAVDTMGIELSALFAAGAIFAVGFGFAMQTIAQNFVSGVILIAEGAIKSGDVLEVDGQLVRVGQMGIRSTVARTLFDEELIIPNSALVQGTVKNFTHHDRLYRLRVGVGVAYQSDMRVVEAALVAMARALPWREPTLEPRVQMVDFGSSSVDWEVSVWIGDPWMMRQRGSALRQAIWWTLKEAGITIAYPQLDVHLDADLVDAVRGPPVGPGTP